VEMRSERIALDKIYKRRDRYDIPDWQRDKVWSPDKERNLIDSILRGWKLPKFYFQKTGSQPDTFDVVDGQQRLMTIWGFLDGDVTLSAQTAKEFGAANYQELSDAASDAFDDYEIDYDVIISATDEEIKEFFQRLQAGLPLTSSEKLNSVHSKLRDYCSRLAKHKFFSDSTTVAGRRHGYFDICSKVLALEIEGLDSGLRFDDVRVIFESNSNFSDSSAVAKRVKSSLDLLHEMFPVKSPALRQRSMIQSVITMTCHLTRAGMADGQATILKSFIEEFSAELLRQVEMGQAATDVDYIGFQRTVNANVKSGAEHRHNILLQKIFARYPNFYSSMSKSKELDDSVSSSIERSSIEVTKLISSINNKYASKHGCDLFKATNKTVPAQVSLNKKISSVDDYRIWVDDLYFIFRESIGERLTDNIPKSFADVNSLRTSLHHDVDHGKGTLAKRKKLATVFFEYSAVSTPEALAADQFSLVQANLLGALTADLRTLFKGLS
jgi:hypothetical protein